MKAAAVALKDLDTPIIVRQNEVSKSQTDQLTRDQLLDIARRLAIHVCDLHFNMRRCRRCTVRGVIEQLGLCDRGDLDKQDEEMRKETASKSRRTGDGVSAYFVPCRCGKCGHRCSNVYGPYFKVHGQGNCNVDEGNPEIQEKVRHAASAFKTSHPTAIFPWDPAWTSHKHSHKEAEEDERP